MKKNPRDDARHDHDADDFKTGWVDVDLDGNPIEPHGGSRRRARKPRPGRGAAEPADSETADAKPDPRDEGEEPGIAGMRVIGGSLKHRRITYSGDIRTRPMKDRVREALFNLVGPPVVGSLAIDLFAGTGALGIEALSRGAVGGVFFEKHFPTADIIKENIKTLGLEERAEVVGCDTFLQWRRLRRDKTPLGGKIPAVKYAATAAAAETAEGGAPAPLPWVVFCSPPYDFFIERQADMLKLIDEFLADMPPGSVFVVEADERFDLNLLPRAEDWTSRTYAPAVVALLHYAHPDDEEFDDPESDEDGTAADV